MFDYKTGQERSDEFIDDYDKFKNMVKEALRISNDTY